MHECHITRDKPREKEMILAKEYNVVPTSLLFSLEHATSHSHNIIRGQAIVTSLFTILSLLYGIGFD